MRSPDGVSLLFRLTPAVQDDTIHGAARGWPGRGSGGSGRHTWAGTEERRPAVLAPGLACVPVSAGSASSSDASFLPFKEIKEELEDLNKEIKKTANRIRGKLKCKLAFLGAGGVWMVVPFSLELYYYYISQNEN